VLSKKYLYVVLLLMLVLALIYLWCCIVAKANAAPLLAVDYEYDQAASGLGAGPRVVGVRLRSDEDILITHLGAYDSGVMSQEGNGFDVPHEVGVFLLDGTLLGSVDIPSGTAAPLDGEDVDYDLVASKSRRYRYVALGTSVEIDAGQEFVIAASNYGGPLDAIPSEFDRFPIGVVGLELASDISFVEARSTDVGVTSLDYPSTVDGDLHMFAGNFFYSVRGCQFGF
jgi:hypothetical protein